VEAARRARWSDAARLVELCRGALAEISAERGGTELADDVLAGRSVEELVDEAMGDPAALVLAGEYDGVVLGVGIVTAGPPPSWRRPSPAGPRPARIEALYVEPGVRTVGLGEAILDSMTTWAQAQGCDGIDAVALPGSRPTKSIFETNGLVARALVMHRSLDPVQPVPPVPDLP
jgi:GNAT superfamily N-acetyltransferase